MGFLQLMVVTILALSAALVSAQNGRSTGISSGALNVVYKEAFSCEGRNVVLTCPRDHLLKVTEVFFGRNDSTTCVPATGTSAMYRRRCSSSDAMAAVRRLCDDKRMCTFEASRTALGGLSSCDFGTAFLRMTYMCEQTQYKALLCEASGSLPLECPSGSVLQVQSAFFGRRDLQTCPHVSASMNQPCNGVKTLEIFRQVCNGKNSCVVQARTELFGEPCSGNYKYLQLEYLCSECANTHGDDGECDFWRNQGQCTTNTSSTWMMNNCRKACTNCGATEPPCVNLRTDEVCERWRSEGECQISPGFMIAYCRRTCLACDKRTICRSTHQAAPNTTTCAQWVEEGECFQNAGFMLSSCAGHCLCDAQGPDMFVECRNRRPDNDGKCDVWAEDGACDTNVGFMFPNCYRSCSGCTAPPECRNVHSTDDCDFWATDGECVGENAQWMHNNCWRSCTRCETARQCMNVRSNPQCDFWAATGSCVDDAEFMMTNCYMSCSKCRPATKMDQCYNGWGNDTECDGWARSGDCSTNPTWMIPYCRKSCTFCDRSVQKLVRTNGRATPGPVLRVTAGRTFILPELIEGRGRLVNFYGFFANRNPVSLEIWAIENGKQTRVFQQIVTPSGAPQAETFLVESSKCFEVRPGDRLAFTSVNNQPSPISFMFKPEAVQALHFRPAGSNRNFRSMRLPYAFSLGLTYNENGAPCSS